MHTVIKKCGQTVIIDSDCTELYLIQIPSSERYLWCHKGLLREIPRYTIELARELLTEYHKSECQKMTIPHHVKVITWNQTVATPEAYNTLRQTLGL
jgi:hypothetical protein